MNNEDIDFLISIQDLEQPDFDNACLERENKRLNKEIERLNNIIEELEKYLIEYSQDLEFRCYANTFLEKLKELKEGK